MPARATDCRPLCPPAFFHAPTQGLAQRYPLTIRHVDMCSGKGGELATLMPALVDLLLVTETRLERLRLFMYSAEDDAPAAIELVRAALRRWEAARRLPEQVDLDGCRERVKECLEGALAAESEGVRGAVRMWDIHGERF